MTPSTFGDFVCKYGRGEEVNNPNANFLAIVSLIKFWPVANPYFAIDLFVMYFVQFYTTVGQYFCEMRPDRVFVTVFSECQVIYGLLNSVLVVKKQISIYLFIFLNLVLSVVSNISVYDEGFIQHVFALFEAVQCLLTFKPVITF